MQRAVFTLTEQRPVGLGTELNGIGVLFNLYLCSVHSSTKLLS